MSELVPVFVGEPLPAALNEEREAINLINEDLPKKLNKPTSPTLGSLLRFDGDNWVSSKTRLYEGEGSPEGVISAPPGSRYVDTSGLSALVEWFKQSGSGNTGWSPLNSGTPWTNISPGTGFVHVSGKPGQVCMSNGVVYFRGAMRRTSGTGTVIGSISADLAPDAQLDSFIRAGSSWLMFSLTPAGAVQIAGTLVSNQDVYLNSIAGTPYRIV